MRWWSRLRRRKRMEEELEKELRFHLDQHTDDLIAQGLDPEEARRQARFALGGPEQVKERLRDTRSTRWLEDLLQDLRYGARMLMKYPGFAIVGVITLAEGIAANTTIFSIADALVLRPFNFPTQERLVKVWEAGTLAGGFDHGSVAPGNFNDWREQNQSFERLIGIQWRSFDLTDANQPERFVGRCVSTGFFDALGVKPALGRAFLPGEDEPDGGRLRVDPSHGAAPVRRHSHRSVDVFYDLARACMRRAVGLFDTGAAGDKSGPDDRSSL
jgi:putative ABC transport system permease protein